MATVLEDCTTEEQHSGVRFFCGQRDSVQMIFMKKGFLFMVESVCHVKRFTAGLRNMANISLMTKRLKWRCKSG
jgi:hypothetical protein